MTLHDVHLRLEIRPPHNLAEGSYSHNQWVENRNLIPRSAAPRLIQRFIQNHIFRTHKSQSSIQNSDFPFFLHGSCSFYCA